MTFPQRYQRHASIVLLTGILSAAVSLVFIQLSAQAPDTTPPVITALATNKNVFDVGEAIIITWTTNEPADSQYEFGMQTASINMASNVDSTLVTSHSMNLWNVSPEMYYYRVKSKDAAGNIATSSNGVFAVVGPSASADSPPSVSLSVLSANPQVAGFRPGVRAYYSMTVSDDKELRNVMVTTSQMMYSAMQNQMYQCQGKTFCEEKVYIIVPANPGPQFVAVTAVDSADQAVTKTVNFDAPACATDADCGGGSIQWAGATYCGSESGGLERDIMQYGVAATCKSGGICDTSSLPRVKQKCASGQVCTFGANGVNLCIAQPPSCTVGAQITSVCTCGNVSMNYPYDWRVSTPTYCCRYSDGSFYTYGNASSCLALIEQAVPSTPSPSGTASGATTSPVVPSNVYNAAPSTPANGSWPVPSAVPATPIPPRQVPAAVPSRMAAPNMPTPPISLQPQSTSNGQTPTETPVLKLTSSQVKTLKSLKKFLVRELRSIERVLKRLKNKGGLERVSDLMDSLIGFKPVDSTAYDTIRDLQDDVEDLADDTEYLQKKATKKLSVKKRRR